MVAVFRPPAPQPPPQPPGPAGRLCEELFRLMVRTDLNAHLKLALVWLAMRADQMSRNGGFAVIDAAETALRRGDNLPDGYAADVLSPGVGYLVPAISCPGAPAKHGSKAAAGRAEAAGSAEPPAPD